MASKSLVAALGTSFILLSSTSAGAASLVPTSVQANAQIAVEALGEQVARNDDVGPTEITGTIGICGKKRGRPYNCAIDIASTLIKPDGRGDWLIEEVRCRVWLRATRQHAWFPPSSFGCPPEWMPGTTPVRPPPPPLKPPAPPGSDPPGPPE